ncbi:hypothetical protein ZWY2020_019502 [Hordeum vulgare]|nr:hypothetical protein ZWY2020_019502 [Hordeum vulgare]
MFGEAGDYEGIQFVFKEMREVGTKPNIFVYNALLEARQEPASRASPATCSRNDRRGRQAQRAHAHRRGQIYGRARWGRDALQLWDQMREKKIPADSILCNTLLSMCADVGLVARGRAALRGDEGPGPHRRPQPDKWSYGHDQHLQGIKDADARSSCLWKCSRAA